ncbi:MULTISPECIES: hypothetical protein [unclassified Leifsonia]|uniref:hypothetical protein n=1 Tax=unclassified Leifsonia TaxID=2663824 RepID=UPI00105E4EF7|nr:MULTISPECIES: hypothetical protein [unclassified Leifsonia]TDQ02771.1 hypothetical protein AXZ95_1050 [Leifsonia sp. 115AMFTsu3.1]
MQLVVFGRQLAKWPPAYRVLIVTVSLASSIGGTLIVTSAMDVVRVWMKSSFPAVPGVLMFVVAVPAAWFLYFLVPQFALYAASTRRAWGKWGLTAAGVIFLGAAFPYGSDLLTWLPSVLAGMLLSTAAVVSWVAWRQARRNPAGKGAPPLRTRASGSVRTARRYFVFGGLLGLHSIYLGRGWQAVLYMSMLLLSFLNTGTGAAVLLAGAVCVMLTVDFLRLDDFNSRRPKSSLW